MTVILTARRGESFIHDVTKAEWRWGGFGFYFFDRLSAATRLAWLQCQTSEL